MTHSVWKTKGVFPYIFALFLNAFTDLGHKIIVQNTVFKIYDDQLQIILTSLLNALILLPFVLLFTPSGYLSGRYSKAKVMQISALAAVFITLLITLCYYQGWFSGAFFLTLLLAGQSALYSPAKYGYIKELVTEGRLTSLNGIVQSVTTIAILSGIMVYTVMFETSLTAVFSSESDIIRQIAPLGWLLVIGSFIEWILTLFLPSFQSHSQKKFNIKKYLNGSYLRRNLGLTRRKGEIYHSIIVLSLFWSISQVLLATFGAYAKSTLGVTNTILVQGLMALSAVGIIIGSYVAAAFSRHYLHKGLIVAGSGIITFVLGFLPFSHELPVIGLLFFSFGIGGAMMIVTLNAIIQSHAPRAHLSSILAGNNWIQNIFMIGFLGLTTLFALIGWDALILFYTMFFVSLILSLKLLRRYLDHFIWLIFQSLLSLRYHIVPVNTHHIPKQGAVLLLGNHISWIDWVLAQVGIERRIRYMMERSIYEKPLIRPIMKVGQVIPISQGGAKGAFKEARNRLKKEEIVGLFPEGSISYTGEMGKFYPGYQMIASSGEGMIVPFYIDGIYGSLFSRASKRSTPRKTLFRRKVQIIYGPPMSLDSDPKSVYDAITHLKESYGTQ